MKATDIPTQARIIAVADAYDAMTSKRSYREPIPQQKVREEIVKGIETQFDPYYARLMLHMIDLDSNYEMKEQTENTKFSRNDIVQCDRYREQFTDGINITRYKAKIKMHCEARNPGKDFYPALILFDSLDARIHDGEREQKDLMFCEYCQLKANGDAVISNIRKMEVVQSHVESLRKLSAVDVEIEGVKQKDHILLKVCYGNSIIERIIALNDNTRYAYASITGENCIISNISVERDNHIFPEGKIKRIAPEIVFFEAPEGDIPSIQIDSWRTAHSKEILLDRSMNISFLTKSLPFARLVWHCPFVVFYTSQNGTVYGPNYKELGLLRLDGECWFDSVFENNFMLDKTDDFHGWEEWKQKNKECHQIEISFVKKAETISLQASCGGLNMKGRLTFNKDLGKVYIALTGDQCVIENIKINEI